MSTWPGWAEKFLETAILGHTAGQVQFLHDWSRYSRSPMCHNNPIDLTRTSKGSSNCIAVPGSTKRHFQAYPSRVAAAEAFGAEILTGPYPDLEAAILSGHPWTFEDVEAVAADLTKWGAINFAPVYLKRATNGSKAVTAARAHKGYDELRRAMNHDAPASLHRHRSSRRAALRILHRGRKVKL